MHVDNTGYLIIQEWLQAKGLSIYRAPASDFLAAGYNYFSRYDT